jgi:hypothetical protein
LLEIDPLPILKKAVWRVSSCNFVEGSFWVTCGLDPWNTEEVRMKPVCTVSTIITTSKHLMYYLMPSAGWGLHLV